MGKVRERQNTVRTNHLALNRVPGAVDENCRITMPGADHQKRADISGVARNGHRSTCDEQAHHQQ